MNASLSRAVVFSLLLGLPPLARADGPSPLIGNWQGVIHSQGDNYNMAFHMTYYPDNTFTSAMAIPTNRQTGTGSGMIYSRGRWRMTGPQSVELNTLDVQACPAGGPCLPTPNGLGSQQISYRMEGPDKVVSSDGTTSYRVH